MVTRRQDIGWFDEHPAGELPSAVTSAMAKVQDGIGRKVTYDAGLGWARLGWAGLLPRLSRRITSYVRPGMCVQFFVLLHLKVLRGVFASSRTSKPSRYLLLNGTGHDGRAGFEKRVGTARCLLV